MNITGHGIHILPGEWTAGTWHAAHSDWDGHAHTAQTLLKLA